MKIPMKDFSMVNVYGSSLSSANEILSQSGDDLTIRIVVNKTSEI